MLVGSELRERPLAGTTKVVFMPRDHALRVRLALASHRDSMATVYREGLGVVQLDDTLSPVIDGSGSAATAHAVP